LHHDGIVGTFQDSTGDVFGFIGTPTPEPGFAAIGLMAIALMALRWRNGLKGRDRLFRPF